MDTSKKIYSIASGKLSVLIIAIIAIFTLSNSFTAFAVGEFDRWAGTVTDTDGTPLDATIRIGTMQTGTNAKGEFQLYVPRNYEDSSYVINVESHGYVPISQIHIGEALQALNLQMRKAQIFDINPQEVIDIKDDRGTQIVIQPGSLVDANGNPATGPLQLSVYTYDITEEEMVGNMSGQNSAGELVSMESVGAFFAEFTDQSGNEYNLGQGSNAEISVPNDPTGNFPTTVPLWSYNTETGLWVEEGQATLQEGRYVGDVSHFSFWNFDAEKRTPACIRLTVDKKYLDDNKPIRVKALLLSPLRARYLNIVQGTNVLINLPVNTNVEFYIPTTATTPFAVVNTSTPWGGRGIPSYPYAACNASLHIDGSHDKGKLWGTKFHDINGNGAQDDGELGLSGWTITATDADGNSFSTVTDFNGHYRLLLLPGVYSVVEVQQPGWTQTHPATTAHTVTVEAAKTTEKVDFGNTDQGRLWGKKFHDINGDGVRDADEPGLPGWTITATDADGNSFSAVTDANGNYRLPLSAGSYSVVEVQQPGWVQTFPATTAHTVTIEPAKTTENVDFGNTDQGRLWGKKFHDIDGDGVRDADEPGLPGWTITATDANGNSFSAITDANGNYRLPLSAGVYSVVEVQQPGWAQTFPATTAHTVTIEPAKTTENVNFGNTDQGRLWGKKFHDIDGDGVRDADEPGLPGWTITATDANGNSFSAITDADGNYRLPLSAGVYSVVEVQQPGWAQTFPATTAHTVTIEPAKTTERVDFGNTELCQSSKIEATGAIYTDTPPSNIGKNVNESDDTIVFNEVENFVLTDDIDVDITTSGSYTNNASLSLGTLTAGTTVNSYLVRLDPEKVLVADMTIKFGSRILGIVVRGRLLLNSQALARPDVNYPVGSQLSGLEFNNDWITLHPDMQTIELHLKTSSPGDNIRVITEAGCDMGDCPDPLAIDTAGIEFLSTPPSDVSPNTNEGDGIIAFNEKLDIAVPNSGVAVDITAPGTYDSVSSLTPGTLSNNVPVHSYLVRFDPKARTRVTGTIKFSEKIVGVIVTSALLDSSDLLGHSDVTYPKKGIKLRGIEIHKNDSVIVHPDMQTLEFNLQAKSPGDHIRVITAVSCPEDKDLPPASPVNYFSSSSGGKVSGIRFADEDILVLDPDTGRWAMYFDGSDVGLGTKKQDVNAFHVLENGDILLSTIVPFKADGVTYDDSDIVHFAATSLGTNTAGSFKMYLDGSDVQLTKNGEDIDAIAFAPNGDLVISTLGNSKTDVRAKDDDLLQFNSGTFGDNTTGTWSLYFDGSDAGFTKGSEDIWATWINTATQEIHLSTAGNYNVSSSGMNITGDGDDVFVCTPSSIGSSTKCTFHLDWNGDDHSFGKEKIDGYSAGTMPTGLIFSASRTRLSTASEESSIDSDIFDDIAGDDVLEEEDVISRLYLPFIEN